jgi:hypothetical protein
VVLMAHIVGALGGPIPRRPGVGAVGGMVGMLILYAVEHNAAVAPAGSSGDQVREKK